MKFPSREIVLFIFIQIIQSKLLKIRHDYVSWKLFFFKSWKIVHRLLISCIQTLSF